MPVGYENRVGLGRIQLPGVERALGGLAAGSVPNLADHRRMRGSQFLGVLRDSIR